MRPRRFRRQWGWPKRWWTLFDAMGWRGCKQWSHNFTWRDA